MASSNQPSSPYPRRGSSACVSIRHAGPLTSNPSSGHLRPRAALLRPAADRGSPRPRPVRGGHDPAESPGQWIAAAAAGGQRQFAPRRVLCSPSSPARSGTRQARADRGRSRGNLTGKSMPAQRSRPVPRWAMAGRGRATAGHGGACAREADAGGRAGPGHLGRLRRAMVWFARESATAGHGAAWAGFFCARAWLGRVTAGHGMVGARDAWLGRLRQTIVWFAREAGPRQTRPVTARHRRPRPGTAPPRSNKKR